jgi:23S rRNA pseudouridine1911/1915/1917 synthase
VNESQFLFEVEAPGGRLDHILVAELEEFSRTRLQKVIREGYVKVNGACVLKPAFPLEGGEVVEITLPAQQPAQLTPEKIPLDIVYEDQDIILINKPPGMVVHPSVGHEHGTLVHAVLNHAPDIRGIGGELRPGVVHRLDKDTSGLIIMAKHDQAHVSLQRQFARRQVNKIYLALVDGRPPTPKGKIDAPVGRDPQNRKKMAIHPKGSGREAVSFFDTLEAFPDHSLLEVRPLTGRTHQIRTHLAFIKCPIVGDRTYGRRKPSLPVSRQMLHAAKLTFRLPSKGEEQEFVAPLTEDFAEALDALRVSVDRKGGKGFDVTNRQRN